MSQLFTHPIGQRALKPVWKRQLRWARIRRMGFPGIFAAEILSGLALPAVLTLVLILTGFAPVWLLPIGLALWLLPEWLLAAREGWPRGIADIVAWLLRDLMIPAIWVGAWIGSGFEWRGNPMSTADLPLGGKDL